MGLKAAWKALTTSSDSKDYGPPQITSQFTVPTGTGYISYSPRTIQNVTQIGYMNNITVYRAVSVLAQSIAALKWQVRSRYGKQDLIEGHPIELLLERPNLKRARSSFIEQYISYLLIGGQNYMYPVMQGSDPRPIGLYNLRPDLVSPVYGEDGQLVKWRYNVIHPTTYLPEQLQITRFFHPFDELAGLSPLQVAAAVIERQNAGEEWNFNLMSNMARPSGAFVSNVDLPPLTRGKLVQEIRKKYGRGRQTAGMPLLLENGLSYIQLALSPVDADWFTSDGSAGRKIAAAIGIDSVLLNDKEHSTYNNVLEAKVAMWELTGLSLISRVEDEYNMWLPKCYGDDVIVSCDKSPIALLKKNRSLDTSIVINQWNSGLMSFNQGAIELVQPTIDDKDDFYKFGPMLYVRTSEIPKWLDMQEERRNAPPITPVPPSPQLLPTPVKPGSEVSADTDTAKMIENIRLTYTEFGTHLLKTAEHLRDVLTYLYVIAAEEACYQTAKQFGVVASIYNTVGAEHIAECVRKDMDYYAQLTKDVIPCSDEVDALQDFHTMAQRAATMASNVGSYLGASQVTIPLKKSWVTLEGVYCDHGIHTPVLSLHTPYALSEGEKQYPECECYLLYHADFSCQ